MYICIRIYVYAYMYIYIEREKACTVRLQGVARGCAADLQRGGSEVAPTWEAYCPPVAVGDITLHRTVQYNIV